MTRGNSTTTHTHSSTVARSGRGSEKGRKIGGADNTQRVLPPHKREKDSVLFFFAAPKRFLFLLDETVNTLRDRRADTGQRGY